MFETPDAVFPEEMLKPEKQNLEVFVSGVEAIVEAQCRVARNYFEDGSIDAACPPLRALLHIMADGHFEGKDAHHPEIRAMFTRDPCSRATGIAPASNENSRSTLLSGPATSPLSRLPASRLSPSPSSELDCRLTIAEPTTKVQSAELSRRIEGNHRSLTLKGSRIIRDPSHPTFFSET